MNHVVVTGADRGLGYALCEAFLARGWQVYAGRFLPDWPALDQLKQRCGDRLTLVPLDVSCGDSVAAAARAVAAHTCRVDMLINNAGIVNRGEGTLGEADFSLD
ncbi:MAG: SDR family NAD(P)-dependent oxidoreductase, partial [Eubacteriales bacterium]|nr:SDR family NAD(P)-dependent oxidoreductase [Eubacteriales bacterium]